MKFLPTLFTFMFWIKMKFHVTAQLTFRFEESSFRADCTFMLSFIAVSCLVIFQMCFLSKSLATSRAHKWFRTCVNSSMNSKFRFRFKNLQANVALVRIGLIVFRSVMINKSTSAWKCFITNSTIKLSSFDVLNNFTF